ncbi:DinB family protein [Ornithinimicrobium cerasi]|uniref:Pentapeptide repeat-containing protein n=1 Tax=Ornithinimicrobium cerasi TaxID=2248773 RepID=A0A285VDF6_9MICO|nr:pentapeptide repeat-containing protein [Ornithinimicrobium cerasi]SOC52100.1 Pentapeptide repeat-containing protein [Ornithinimicrobium cerasi]
MTQTRSFRKADLAGAAFEEADLSGAAFRLVDLSDARMHNTDLSRARLTGVVLQGAVLDGDIRGLVVNGVEVAPLVEAELDRRHPDRALMRPVDAEGYRTAWARLGELWDGTVARASALEERAPGLVHDRVDGEWSFVETLRHLLFATDAWVGRALLGDPAPYHPLVVPHEEESSDPGVPWDPDARPSLGEVLEARATRRGTVTDVLRDLDDARLARRTEPVDGPGFPPARPYVVAEVLGVVLNEEWEHRLFAERDLDVLEGRLCG